MAEPWDMEKRARTARKIERESKRVKENLGASHVVVIAFFQEDQHLHMQDAGNPPMEFEKLYTQLATMHKLQQESEGDVGYLS